MIPGMNLLEVALGAIAPQEPVEYLQAVDRTTNSAGYLVATYAAPVPVKLSSVQAVSRSTYYFQGLDLSKKYVTWYVPREVLGLERDSSGDRMTYNGELFQVENTTDWAGQDGWVAALCVRLGAGHA